MEEISERGEYEITDSVSLQIAEGKKVLAHETTKNWIDIGRPWELIEVNSKLIGDIKTNIKGKIESGVSIHGDIILEEGSIISGVKNNIAKLERIKGILQFG